MKLSRNFTNIFNWILDNLVPPFIRDSRIFSQPLFWMLFGKKGKLFMNFKNKAAQLSDVQMADYYKKLADVHIQRPTDLNKACIDYILNNIKGQIVLDIACGRGYLAQKIAAKNDVQVTGIDFIIGDELKSSVNPVFLEATIEKIPFPDRHFDTVICTHTLEHVISIQQAIAELRRVCNQQLIIVLPRQREYKYTFDLHVHFFPYQSSVSKILNHPKGNCICLNNDWLYIEKMTPA